MQSLGDMPLRLSELSLRTPRFTGVVVSRLGSGTFAESGGRMGNREKDEYILTMQSNILINLRHLLEIRFELQQSHIPIW